MNLGEVCGLLIWWMGTNIPDEFIYTDGFSKICNYKTLNFKLRWHCPDVYC